MCSLLYNVLLLFVKLRRIGLLKSIPCCLILSFVVKCTLLVFNQAQLVLSICHPCTFNGRQFLSSIHKDWQTNLSPYFVLLIAGIFVIFLFNIYISPFTLGQQFVIHVLFTGEPICLFIWFLFSNHFQVFRRSSPQCSGVKCNQIYELIQLYTRWIYLYQTLASWGHQLDHVKLWNKL